MLGDIPPLARAAPFAPLSWNAKAQFFLFAVRQGEVIPALVIGPGAPIIGGAAEGTRPARAIPRKGVVPAAYRWGYTWGWSSWRGGPRALK